MTTKTAVQKQWFEAEIYLDHELVGTTVYYLPVNTTLQSSQTWQGTHEREMVLKPVSIGDLFNFKDEQAAVSYRCDNPFSQEGWSVLRKHSQN